MIRHRYLPSTYRVADQDVDNHIIPYVLQDMTIADVPDVAALEQVCFTMPWSSRAFDHEVRYNPMAHFVVLRLEAGGCEAEASHNAPWWTRRTAHAAPGKLIGYGGLWLIVDEGHICTLAVHPAYRGLGLGELILIGLIERATVLGAAVATLEVRVTNEVAQSLYDKYGFAQVGVRKGYYTDTHEDALIMTTGLLSSEAYQQHLRRLKTTLVQRLAGASRLTQFHTELE